MLIYLFKSLRFPPHGLIEHISFPFPIACRLTACQPTQCCLLPAAPLPCCPWHRLLLCLPVSIPVLFNLPPDTSLTATGHEQNFCSIYFFQLYLSLSLPLTLAFVLSHSRAFFFVSLYREYEESQVAKMLKQNEKSRPEPVNVMTGSVTSGPGSKHRMRIRTKQCPPVTEDGGRGRLNC